MVDKFLATTQNNKLQWNRNKEKFQGSTAPFQSHGKGGGKENTVVGKVTQARTRGLRDVRHRGIEWLPRAMPVCLPASRVSLASPHSSLTIRHHLPSEEDRSAGVPNPAKGTVSIGEALDRPQRCTRVESGACLSCVASILCFHN